MKKYSHTIPTGFEGNGTFHLLKLCRQMLLLSMIFSTFFAYSQFEEPTSSIVWHWEDDFSTAEQTKVEEWLNSVTSAAEATLGVYPFHMHFFIHRSKESGEPVPWASTRRHAVQGIDFHIDPSYPLESFLDDWTAPHEISHLSIPYLGGEHRQNLSGFIKDYLLCYRLKDESLTELIESWDHLLGEPIFSELLHTYQSAPASEVFK